MSWYYVGPDAKPVGPISLEELQARRASGAIAPETYVIEAPAGSAPKEWSRFRDAFPHAIAFPPGASALPPLPVATSPVVPSTMGIPHPLFPSAPPVTPSPGGPVFTGTHPSEYRLPPRKNNAWCLWGFGLGIASLPCLFCGIGFLFAPIALVFSIIGLVQVSQHREQHGRGLAVAGLIASLIALFIVAIVGMTMLSSTWHSVVSMTTEQTSNDSDTK
jgi:hypothetical protein